MIILQVVKSTKSQLNISLDKHYAEAMQSTNILTFPYSIDMFTQGNFEYDKPSLICPIKNSVKNITCYPNQILYLNILLLFSVYEYGYILIYIIFQIILKHIILLQQFYSKNRYGSQTLKSVNYPNNTVFRAERKHSLWKTKLFSRQEIIRERKARFYVKLKFRFYASEIEGYIAYFLYVVL